MTERYQECGDFVLDIPLNAANFQVYKRGNYVMFEDSDESMIVESVKLTKNLKSRRGSFWKSIDIDSRKKS